MLKNTLSLNVTSQSYVMKGFFPSHFSNCRQKFSLPPKMSFQWQPPHVLDKSNLS